ncbi:MAG: transporter ATP-binding protein [Microbacteriaceae bacterium]|jgi:peptide/nickel transport system ATP-binding protein|nr:transporter ATP-binding protein [Microbacteriaceae bacterium]
MSALLEVRDLSVRFGDSRVVAGVDFEIEPGECLAIVGESGSGKSVTARSILGLAGTGARVQASVLRFDTTNLLDASPRRLRGLRGREIGFVSQGALVALDPLLPVGREVADTLRIHTSLTPRQRQTRVVELLAEAGVPEPGLRAAQRPDELSGGLRQRAVIASAVAMRPRLLIADEPTTALDTTVQAGILELLDRLRADGTAILLISHDLAVVSRLASRIAVMEQGRIVETGATAQVLQAPRHPYTRRLIAAVPTDRPRGSRLTVAPVAPAVEVPHDVVLEARGLVRRFGSRTAADDVSFTLERGRTLGVVGESGSGKTTVARLVLGLEHPDAGDVRLLGEPWSSARERDRRVRRPRIGAIYQDALSSFDPRLTVGQILADALSGGRSRRADVSELLLQVGLDPSLARRRPRFLSGGQQQRVAIARAIAPRPDILVCDEPVSSLDVSVQAQVLDLLDDLQRSHGLSYLFITHDLGVVRHMSDDVLVMRDGRVLESGATETVFSAPRQDYTRALIDAAPRIG